MTSRTRRQFTPEFEAEAVALVEASGGNVAKVAKELKLYDSTLGNKGLAALGSQTTVTAVVRLAQCLTGMNTTVTEDDLSFLSATKGAER